MMTENRWKRHKNTKIPHKQDQKNTYIPLKWGTLSDSETVDIRYCTSNHLWTFYFLADVSLYITTFDDLWPALGCCVFCFFIYSQVLLFFTGTYTRFDTHSVEGVYFFPTLSQLVLCFRGRAAYRSGKLWVSGTWKVMSIYKNKMGRFFYSKTDFCFLITLSWEDGCDLYAIDSRLEWEGRRN